jgi:hypothetical protein
MYVNIARFMREKLTLVNKAIGVALEARRLDTIEACINHAFQGGLTNGKIKSADNRLLSDGVNGVDDQAKKSEAAGAELINYVFEASMALVANKRWRDEVCNSPLLSGIFTLTNI